MYSLPPRKLSFPICTFLLFLSKSSHPLLSSRSKVSSSFYVSFSALCPHMSLSLPRSSVQNFSPSQRTFSYLEKKLSNQSIQVSRTSHSSRNSTRLSRYFPFLPHKIRCITKKRNLKSESIKSTITASSDVSDRLENFERTRSRRSIRLPCTSTLRSSGKASPCALHPFQRRIPLASEFEIFPRKEDLLPSLQKP